MVNTLLNHDLSISHSKFLTKWLLFLIVQTRQHHVTSSSTVIPANGTNGAQLHKLLVNSTAAPTIITTGSNASELTRLPGGAELNILPAGINGTPIYRGNGKLTILNNGMTIKGKFYNLISWKRKLIEFTTGTSEVDNCI